MELFGVGPLELMVIGVVALMVFGPKKLPELAQNLGKVMRGLKETSRDFERELKREFVEPPAPVAPIHYDVIESVQQPALPAEPKPVTPEAQS